MSVTDSGVETNYTSDMESITSSNYQFQYRNHRRLELGILSSAYIHRYHGLTSPYSLPNDEDEKYRLDELQFVCHSFLGKNILAPLPRRPRPTQIGLSPIVPSNEN